MTNPKITRAERRESLRTLLAGIAKHFSGVTTLTLAGQTMTPGELAKLVKELIGAHDDADKTKRIWHESVGTVRTKEARLHPILLALEQLLGSQHGRSSPTLGDFGFAPAKKPKTTSDVKAEAVLKRQATREARGIMGKRQRQKLNRRRG